jgi:hypothetical protein
MWHTHHPSSSPADYSHIALNHQRFQIGICDVHTVPPFKRNNHVNARISIEHIVEHQITWNRTQLGTRMPNQNINDNIQCKHNGQPDKIGIRHELVLTLMSYLRNILGAQAFLNCASSHSYETLYHWSFQADVRHKWLMVVAESRGRDSFGDGHAHDDGGRCRNPRWRL